jgi:3-deoxy-D-manno-octulosonate 8-phosphate phosphatase (KDO 8-P phosphatase)
MKSSAAVSLRRRLARVRCLLLDVDGVLTDGKLQFTSDGQEIKTFDILDGHGIAMAQRAGLLIGWISGRPSAATAKRAADLGVKILLQAPVNKVAMLEEVKREHGLTNEEIAFVGDELVDLPVLRRVGFAVAVPNAVAEVKAAAHYVTRRRGGDGAVREVIEMILKARQLWRKVTAKYMVLLAAALLAAAVVRAGSNEPTAYIEKFEVPERDENGNLKWKLNGDRAQMSGDGRMTIVNARAELYTSNKVSLVFTAPGCLLDRANNRATTDTPVRLERENMIITGIGADWDGKASLVMIRSNVQMVIQNARQDKSQ